MRSLPPIPDDWDPSRDVYIGVWSTVALKFEHAGTSFFAKYEQSETSGSPPSSASLSSSEEDTSQNATTDNTQGAPKKKKTFKDHSSIAARVKKAIEDQLDLYGLLSSDPSASADELKKQYKKLALIFHPDKTKQKSPTVLQETGERGSWPDPSKMTAAQLKQHFLNVQSAMEILLDETHRRQYDSSLPFDDDLPKASDITTENFYEICGPAFLKEAKWSEKKPVPHLGDAKSAIEEVHRFYDFWLNDFVSWRDFSHHAEFELEEAQDREERRWMQKENWRIVSKFVKQERQRVMDFVTMAESKDPRILAEKEAERQRKEQAKLERVASQQSAQKKVIEERRRREEEAKAAEQAAAKEAADAKKAEKKRIVELRKRIRGIYRPWCCDTGTSCEFTADDLQDFCVNASMTYLVKMADQLTEVVADATPQDNPACCDEVAQCIRRIMSEWNNSRYKSSFAPAKISAEPLTKPTGRVWSAEDLSLLSKGLVRFPGGTPNRWAQIAKFMGEGFTPDDVITQTKQLSEGKNFKASNVVPVQNAYEQSQRRIPEIKKKIDAPPDLREQQQPPQQQSCTPATTIPPEPVEWTAEQQSALEKALAMYPASQFSGNPQLRWQKIAGDVPGRSAKQCLARFKEVRQAILASQQQKAAS